MNNLKKKVNMLERQVYLDKLQLQEDKELLVDYVTSGKFLFCVMLSAVAVGYIASEPEVIAQKGKAVESALAPLSNIVRHLQLFTFFI